MKKSGVIGYGLMKAGACFIGLGIVLGILFKPKEGGAMVVMGILMVLIGAILFAISK